MSEFDKSKIRRLDGTLLLIFRGLMRSGKAAEVAADLGLATSSISHALRRLRDVFGDELFLRRPHGLEPNAFALAIEPEMDAALDALQTALAGPSNFDPANAVAHLRLSARDSEIAATLPGALAEIRRQAPGLTFALQSMAAPEAVQALRDGALDLAVGFIAKPTDDLDQEVLRRENYLVVARQGWAPAGKTLSLEAFTAAKHVLVSADGSMWGIVDDHMARIGAERRVVLSVPSFLSALALVGQTDLLSTLPATLVRRYGEAFGLMAMELPIEVRDFKLSVLTHARNRRNMVVCWCVQRIVESASQSERN